jgi:hypothetical protein
MVGNGTLLNIVAEGLSLLEGNILINLTNTFGTLTVHIYQENTDNASKQALIDLYTATNGPAWSYPGLDFSKWANHSSDPCADAWVSNWKREGRGRE